LWCVETKYKGLVTVILIKFWFRKWFKMSEGSFTSNENDGSFLFTLASLEGLVNVIHIKFMLVQVIVQQQLNSMLILHN
jgi:hypothetical protein